MSEELAPPRAQIRRQDRAVTSTYAPKPSSPAHSDPTRRRRLSDGKTADALAAKAAFPTERACPLDRRVRALSWKARNNRVSYLYRGLQARVRRARIATSTVEWSCGTTFPVRCSEPHSGADVFQPLAA